MEVNVDDIGSFMPAAGSKLPSQVKTCYSKGAYVDSILKDMDREDIFREVSKHPVGERKAMLRKLFAERRRIYGE